MPSNNPMLTDGQWEKLAPLLPQLRTGKPGGVTGRRAGVCRRGFYGSPAMGRAGRIWLGHIPPLPCWRRRRDWEEQEVWLTIWRIFLGELNRRGCGVERSLHRWQLRFREKGALESERPKGQLYKLDGGGRWQGHSFGKKPGVGRSPASSLSRPKRHGRGRPPQKPQILIADKAHDSAPLRISKETWHRTDRSHKANRVRASAGRSSGPTHGFTTSAASSSDTSAFCPSTQPSSTLRGS